VEGVCCIEELTRCGAEIVEEYFYRIIFFIHINSTTMKINDLTGIEIEECIKIHKDLGPGLFESVYEEILFYRPTKKRNLK
jgi:hypothetical protein